MNLLDFITPEMLKIIVSNGVFCLLFVGLLVYVMRKSDQRENRLYDEIDKSRNLLEKFSEKYDIIINEIKDLKDKFK